MSFTTACCDDYRSAPKHKPGDIVSMLLIRVNWLGGHGREPVAMVPHPQMRCRTSRRRRMQIAGSRSAPDRQAMLLRRLLQEYKPERQRYCRFSPPMAGSPPRDDRKALTPPARRSLAHRYQVNVNRCTTKRCDRYDPAGQRTLEEMHVYLPTRLSMARRSN